MSLLFRQTRLYFPQEEDRDLIPKFFFKSKYLDTIDKNREYGSLFFSSRLVKLVTALGSQGFNIIRDASFGLNRIPTSMPNFYIVNTNLAETQYHLNATGTSFVNINEAVLRCLGEAVERWHLTVMPSVSQVTTPHTFEQMQKKHNHVFDPSIYDIYQKDQTVRYPNMGHISGAAYAWSRVRELVSGTQVYIPTQLVFMGYTSLPTESRALQHVTSNGMALGPSAQHATVASILEIIERDHFLLFWLSGAPLRRIVQDGLDYWAVSLLQMYKMYGLDVEIYVLDYDMGIPTYMCVMWDRRMDPELFVVATTTSFNISAGLEKALREAHMLTLLVLKNNKTIPVELYDAMYLFRHLHLHNRHSLTQHPLIIGKMKELLNDAVDISSEDLYATYGDLPQETSGQYTYIMRQIDHNGFAVYEHQFKSKHARQLGVHVHRAIIPDMLSMYLSEHFAPLAHPRIKKYLDATGHTLNILPHPFL